MDQTLSSKKSEILYVINNVEVFLPGSAEFFSQKLQGKRYIQEHFKSSKKLDKGVLYFHFFGFKKTDLEKAVTGCITIKLRVAEDNNQLIVCVHKTKSKAEMKLFVVDIDDNSPHYKKFNHPMIPENTIVFDRFLPGSFDEQPQEQIPLKRNMINTSEEPLPKAIRVHCETFLASSKSCIVNVPDTTSLVVFEKDSHESNMNAFIDNGILFLSTFKLVPGKTAFHASAFTSLRSDSKCISYVIIRPTTNSGLYSAVLDSNPNGIKFTPFNNGHGNNHFLYFKKIKS